MTMVSTRAKASRAELAWVGGHRTIVTCVHGLHHVERLRAAALADDDAVRAHAEGVDDQVPLRDGARAFDIHGAGLQAHDVFLLHLQFGGVLDRDHSLGFGDEAGKVTLDRWRIRSI
jgi:hypothetical protein